MADILFGIAIALGCFCAVRKKYRDMKKGKFCGCGCEDCPSKCHEKSVDRFR